MPGCLRIAEPISDRVSRERSQVKRGETQAGHEAYTVRVQVRMHSPVTSGLAIYMLSAR